MNLLLKRSYLLQPYILFICWFLFIFLISYFKTTAFSIALVFLFMIFLPGFSLVRIFRISSSNALDRLIFYFTLGLILNLFLCLLGILFGLTINGLESFIIVTIGIIFIISLGLDLIRPDQNLSQCSETFKNIFKWENLIYLFLFGLVILVLSTVDQLGTNFTGDPLDHLAVMRKAIEGQPLLMGNLSFAKNQIDIAYGLPVWHVFLGLLTKILDTNIFVLYREITTVLAGLVFLVWYWFFRKIMPNRNVAILALFLLILYYFGRNAYLYTRLAVPDTLNNYILMPLSFGLALNYIFHKDSHYKHLVILSLMLALMGLIHWTQYFYYLLAMGLFAVFYAIFKYRDTNFWPVFKKILLSIFANMVLIGPILIYLKGIIGQNMENFTGVQKGSNNDRFYKFTPYMQLSFVLLPLIGLFFRKYRRLIFLLAVFLVGPLVYNIPWVYRILRQYLSHVFVNRLYSNLGEWPYIIWAIVLCFILVLIDRLLTKIGAFSKIARYLIDGVLALSFLWLFFIQYKYEALDGLYERIFSENIHLWLNENYYWLIPIVVVLVLIIFIFQRYSKKLLDFFSFSEYKNQISTLTLTLIIILFISIPAQGHLRTYVSREFQNWHFFREATDPSPDFINPDKFGGMAAIDFIKQNIPAKSVFDTNTFASYTLPTLVDVHMASYSIDPIAPTKKYKDLYDVNVPIEKKLVMLKESNIDYLVYQYQDESQTPYDPYPQYFIKIYESPTAAIYKVNKNQVPLDLKS